MPQWYQENLAYIHDVGYRDFALNSAPFIIRQLQQHNIRTGLIVDLGCGTGLSAAELIKANYQVLGIDISEAMIAIAQSRVPQATFRVESFFQTNIPICQAVISVGECLNYRFAPEGSGPSLASLFARIYDALAPGGLFIFDIAEPGQINPNQKTQSFSEGQDWLILVEKEEDPKQAILTRRIISLRKTAGYYQRNDEVHQLKLYTTAEITAQLHQVGFQPQLLTSYGEFQLPQAHTVFIATKDD